MQRTLVFMLKNVLANCKIYDSHANWLITNNYEYISFVSLIYSLVAGVNFAKRDRKRVLWTLTNYKSANTEPFELCC